MFKNSTFNIVRFLLVFIILTAFFYTYIGIVSPGGKTYSPFLDHYANFPAWLTYFICQCAKGVLQIMGYDVYQKSANNVTIHGSHGVTIIWACLGFGVMSFWTAFVTAHKAGRQYKARWIATGIGFITAINVLRIALVALANHYNWKAFNAIEPHFAFTVVSYMAVISLALWFSKTYNHTKKEKLTASFKNE